MRSRWVVRMLFMVFAYLTARCCCGCQPRLRKCFAAASDLVKKQAVPVKWVVARKLLSRVRVGHREFVSVTAKGLDSNNKHTEMINQVSK